MNLMCSVGLGEREREAHQAAGSHLEERERRDRPLAHCGRTEATVLLVVVTSTKLPLEKGTTHVAFAKGESRMNGGRVTHICTIMASLVFAIRLYPSGK